MCAARTAQGETLMQIAAKQGLEQTRQDQAREASHQAVLAEYRQQTQVANARSTQGVGSVRELPANPASTALTANGQQPGLLAANNASSQRRGRGGLMIPGSTANSLNIPTL